MVNRVLIDQNKPTFTFNFPAVGSRDIRILTKWTELNLKIERKEEESLILIKPKGADVVQLEAGGSFYRVVLVWVVVSRGQCITIGFIKAERCRGWDSRKSPATVCGEVDGGLPGPAVISGLL